MEPDHSASAGETRQGIDGQWSAPVEQSIFPSLQELRDLPQRLLPEDTYTHLQNAGREALLAIYSLWQGIEKTRNSSASNKVRKRIDVE